VIQIKSYKYYLDAKRFNLRTGRPDVRVERLFAWDLVLELISLL